MGGVIMYNYILDKHNKRVFEFEGELSNENSIILKSMGIKYSPVFPYDAAGYEDPYSFMEDYEIIKVNANNFLLEVE